MPFGKWYKYVRHGIKRILSPSDQESVRTLAVGELFLRILYNFADVVISKSKTERGWERHMN